jgi:hypothetical protein
MGGAFSAFGMFVCVQRGIVLHGPSDVGRGQA